ncbi:hypothetical protein KAU88_06710 [Candidatus Bathyarchaeota archaeon]|nr:hypothetical protein [Candidatus Bathyarchaeota archaeon]
MSEHVPGEVMSVTIKRSPFNFLEFYQRLSAPLNRKAIKNALTLLRETSLHLSEINQLVIAIFFSKIMKVPEVKDVSFSVNDKTLVLFAYINEPNGEAEDKIYEAYGLLLDLFPKVDIDLKVLELYGRSIEELELCKL